MGLVPLLVAVGCVAVPSPTWPAHGCTAVPVAGPSRVEVGWLDRGVRLRRSDRVPTRSACAPAVVFVPGGLDPGHGDVWTEAALALATTGARVVGWDPRGRGDSGGIEDANGALGQDDLAALLRTVAAESHVDPDAVVVVSRSFGGALVSGALARHPDLRPAAWLDLESPSDQARIVAKPDAALVKTLLDLAAASGDEASWWAARTPLGWMPQVDEPYHRWQGLPDHAQGDDLGAALELLNAATSSRHVVYNGQAVELPVSLDQVVADAGPAALDFDGPWLAVAALQALEPWPAE